MKSREVRYEWTIFDDSMNEVSSAATPALSLTEAELFLPIRMSLDYGEYIVRVLVTMVIDEAVFGPGDDVYTEVEGRFHYVRSEIIAQLASSGDYPQNK